ncbi:hypothetical protein SteCoe_2416 [Stentor coeruleus]|uniref:Uncharacterized protein n=1 Tax=Stentor coeruleus TaxID=5963 RepID=A0A1R2CZG8_9CILI|nr:hypothetical protein SteCoe_2416 [Stentor coeruleus]
MLGQYYSQNPQKSGYKSYILGALAVCLVIGLAYTTLASANSKDLKLVSILEAEENEFKMFIDAYAKNYENEEEYVSRFSKFRDNLAYIRVYNSMGHSMLLGVNRFADMSRAEFKEKYLNGYFSQEQWNGVPVPHAGDIPASVDWRTKGAVTAVKNQGDCGSCWAFSTTGSVEGAWFLAGHTLVSLSEQQLIDCSIAYLNKGCNGGTMNNAFKYIIHNKGIASEKAYPYKAKDGICDKIIASKASASITAYTKVQERDPTALKNATAQQPISIGVDAVVWQMYAGGTIGTNSGCGTDLDHGVLIVGYTTTASPPYWIIKNSWGEDWGLAGYCHVEITSGDGVCGVNMQPSYPVV